MNQHRKLGEPRDEAKNQRKNRKHAERGVTLEQPLKIQMLGRTLTSDAQCASSEREMKLPIGTPYGSFMSDGITQLQNRCDDS